MLKPVGPTFAAILSKVEILAPSQEIKDAVAKRLQEEAQQRYRRPPGECPFCDEHRDAFMMPSHTASDRCESGKHAHCTCDTCF